MEFGQWLQKVRLERKMDLRAFSEFIGVDISTISRVENIRTQPTLSTVIRICTGLEVTPYHLLEALQALSHSDVEPLTLSSHTKNIPSLGDVQAFITFMNRDWHRGSLLLAEMMNRIVTLQLQNKKTNQRNGTRLFGAEDINLLLLDLPLYHFEIYYPSELQADDIWEIYRSGGWVTSRDVGVYLKKVRLEKRVPLVRLQHSVKVSDTVLARLEEGGLERVKLNDVLMLDEQLEQGGRVLVMYWRVYQLNEAMTQFLSLNIFQQNGMGSSSWGGQQLRLVALFTTLCRWFQQEFHTEQGWMNELRQQFEQGASLQDEQLAR